MHAKSQAPLCHYDVVVVGAGISGLQAARLLKRKYSVLLLEASDDVGGRVRNHTFANGDTVDIGGQWLGPGQDRMYRLVAETGSQIFPLYNRGDNLLYDGKQLRRYQGTIPKLNPLALLDLAQMLKRFERMARQLNPEAPWQHPKAQQWDSQTLYSWIERTGFTRSARDLFTVGTSAVFAGAARELSLLHALFYAASGESLERLLAVSGGAQQDRVHGGTWSLCQAMATELKEVLVTGAVVTRIVQHQDGIQLQYDQAEQRTAISADKLILAIPPNQVRRIQFEPALPAWRDQLMQRMPTGNCIKCVAKYAHAFWRDHQLSGQVASTKGPVHVVFDNGEKGKTSGLLMGFVEGDTARQWSGKPEAWQQQQVLAAFATFFGEQALDPEEVVLKNWGEEAFIRGCYAAHFTPGAWTTNGHRRYEPMGHIHWAGTEMASHYYGYMEGALQAAERASAEVNRLLSQLQERAIK